MLLPRPLLLLFIFFFTAPMIQARKGKRGMTTVVRIEKFQPCKGYEKKQSGISGVHLLDVGRGIQLASWDLTIGDDFPQYPLVKATSFKCKTIQDSDCEPFLAGTREACPLFQDKGSFFEEIFAYSPPLICPLKKGVYAMRNTSISGPKLLRWLTFVPEEYFHLHWKIMLMFTEPKPPFKTRICLENMIRLLRVKE